MRRFVGFLAFMAVLGVTAFFAAQRYLGINFSARGIVSRIVPPSKDVKSLLPQGPGTFQNFKIPNGYSMDIFADLKGGLPRVMVFDENYNMLVSVPNSGKVVALLNENDDTKADSQKEVIKGLNKPHGLAVYGGYLYVAETNQVSRYAYNASTQTVSLKEPLFELPGGGRHYTRTIKIYDNKLYTSVGSSCDVCNENNLFRASLLISNLDGTDLKVYATGLRNTVFFEFDQEGRIWGNDMGRDNLGDNLPPDELNIISAGGNYGWPYCFGKNITDTKFDKSGSSICNDKNPSAFDYPAHAAPLGIVRDGDNFLVAFHGSWNSSELVGYKVVKINTIGGQVVNMEDYITGFVKGSDEVLGRPVDLVFDKHDRLYISDDKAGVIYVVYK